MEYQATWQATASSGINISNFVDWMSLLYIWVQTFFLKQHLGMQACFLLMMRGKFQIGYYWNCNVDFLRSAMYTFFSVHPKKAKGAPFTFRFPSCLSLSLSSILLPRSLASSITTGWCTRIVAGVYWGRKLEGKKLVYLQIP